MHRRLLLLGLAGLAGCAVPPAPSVRLPYDAVEGATDPTRSAILNTAYVFAAPGSVAGRPDATAIAVAQLEYLAVEIPHGPRWAFWNPTIGIGLVLARNEVRTACGIDPSAPPQAVIDAFYGFARAERSGDPQAALRALAPPVVPDAAATRARLAALPRLPQANGATSHAAAALSQPGDRRGGVIFGFP
jgi:hypothetical protein